MSVPPPVWKVRIHPGGSLKARDKKGLARHLEALAGTEGIDAELVIRRVRRQRSLEQSAYWFAVPVRIIAEHIGDDVESTHYALLGEWKGYRTHPVTGAQIPNKPSSSALSTVEFSELIEWAMRWGAQTLGVYIPAPNEIDL